jgi:hypothetical protein
MKLKNKAGRKGIIAGILGPYIAAAFIIAAILIFMYQFKYHISQMMVDYFLWGKEFNIPMALFTTDIKGESSVTTLSKIVYHVGNYQNLKDELNTIVDQWFVPASDHYQYTLQMGDFYMTKTVNNCGCISITSYEGGYRSVYLSCDDCDDIKIIKRENVGVYPVPLTYNGTTRTVPMFFSTLVYVKLEGG